MTHGTDPRVTVVVVTWNGAHLLPECLDALARQTVPHAVLVVDNASADDTPAVLARYPAVRVLRLGTNTGFAGGVAAALGDVTTPYVALLNNDARAEPGWLAALVAALDGDPAAAAVTSRLLLADGGRVNNAGGALTRAGVGYDRGLGEPDGPPYDRAVEVSTFSGGAVLLRTDAVRDVGGFPAWFFLYYEDTDVSWRLRRAGLRIRYEPAAVVHHRHAATSDRTSESFAFHNQRNQLLVLLRNAPARVALVALARFVALTGWRVVRPAPGPTNDVRHRVRVFAAVLRLLPATLAQRRALERAAVVPRRTDARRWLGVDSRPL